MKPPSRIRRWMAPTIVIIALVVLGSVFWSELVAWFTGEQIASGDDDGVSVTAGDFEIEASLDPDPPRQEGNVLWLSITDGEGAAVEDAQIEVTYSMPAMGGMPEMRGEAEVEDEGDGRYAAEFDLPMGGSWGLEVDVREDGRSGTAMFGMTVGSSGLTPKGTAAASGDGPMPPILGPQEFDPATLGHLRAAFDAYASIRAALARDSLDGLDAAGKALAASLESASAVIEAPPGVEECLGNADAAARELASAEDLEDARRDFSELSMYLIALASADPRLAEGWHVFTCPMAEGFGRWFQRSPRLENPYMGQKMLSCGEKADWTIEAPKVDDDPEAADDEIAYYTCSMHPSVQQETPGQCPICSMDLTPVTQAEVETGTIVVDEGRRQRIGVRSAPVEKRPLTLEIRAVGDVVHDETLLTDVNLRVSGWVEKLVVDETGQLVRKGQTLFTLYSPELYTTQLEYLAVAGKRGSKTVARLADIARTRLRLLGMTASQIRALQRRGRAQENVPITSPAGGYVIDKNIVEGAEVEAGTQVYRIADLSQVWIDAEVYESDLPHVSVGQPVRIELPFLPGRTDEGEVDYIYPRLEEKTRTGQIRIVVDNPELELKPGMYANVVFEVDLGERLAIPDSAVVYTGPRRIVFVDLGEGRLRPQEVELGAQVDGWVEVKDGLEPADIVVTSGNFLIAAESRLRSALEYWEGAPSDEAP